MAFELASIQWKLFSVCLYMSDNLIIHNIGKNIKKAGIKQKIFYTAIDLFSEKGYTETSIREIASRVGIKESSIYNYYESKQAILDEAFETYKMLKIILQEQYRNENAAKYVLEELIGANEVYIAQVFEPLVKKKKIKYIL